MRVLAKLLTILVNFSMWARSCANCPTIHRNIDIQQNHKNYLHYDICHYLAQYFFRNIYFIYFFLTKRCLLFYSPYNSYLILQSQNCDFHVWRFSSNEQLRDLNNCITSLWIWKKNVFLYLLKNSHRKLICQKIFLKHFLLLHF